MAAIRFLVRASGERPGRAYAGTVPQCSARGTVQRKQHWHLGIALAHVAY